MPAPVWYCPLCHAEGADPAVIFCDTDGARVLPAAERGAQWIGQTLQDRYRVLRFLRAGGMAEVYEAEQTATGRHVALKLLRPGLAANPEVIDRFRQEAEMISLIAHPNVVAIQDFGTHDGSYFMVMELLHGRPLSAEIVDGPMAPRAAFRVVMQVCEGMEAAHARGVLHRDLKPDNIFLEDAPGGGEPLIKILDLGLGKLFGRDVTSGLTRTGAIFGTPEYMSPEQCLGKPVGPGADIYALGAVLHELLLGTPPFTDPSYLAVLTRHVTDPPVWDAAKARANRVPAEAEAVVLRALAKRPEQRQESMLALQGEIAALMGRLRARSHQTGPQPQTRATGSGGRRPSTANQPPLRRASLAQATGADSEVVEVAPDVYWVGRRHGMMLECNSYLRVFRGRGQELSLLIDPGPPKDLKVVLAKVTSVIGPITRLDHIFLNHQDPDVSSNAAAIQELNPHVRIFCSEDTWRLVQFYGLDRRRFTSVESFVSEHLPLATGHRLVFVPTPFCHFRGAVALYDPESGVLFSGDLFGGASSTKDLVAGPESLAGVDLFHQIYMPTTRALARAVERVRRLTPAPRIIAPQHGALVVGAGVERVLDHVAGLAVGLDLLDADARNPRWLGAANEIVRALIRVAGREKAAEVAARRGSDGSFTDLFVVGDGLEITELRVSPRLALDALARAAILATPTERQDELLGQILAIRTRSGS